MKTAKATPSDLSSSRRAQPIRQTRTNPPRSSGSLLRTFDSRISAGGGLGNGQVLEQRTEIFPAITHFADAITALPKELVRHFTLLKEVDAKIFAPEESLSHLVDAALNCPARERRQQTDHLKVTGSRPSVTSVPASINGSATNGTGDVVASIPDAIDSLESTTTAWDPENIPRRQLFRQCSLTMQEMLVSLDEKNHVISTASEALNKQLWRLDQVFPHIEREVSEEARYGSTTHWAYTEMRVNKPVERSRREIGTGGHAASAHQVSVDEAAARSESRKQAMLAKKSRTHHVESDFDDHIDHRHKGESNKRLHGNTKKGRPAEVHVGLGITNGSSVNGNPPSKRRKVEKGPSGGAVMERSLSSVYGTNGTASKAKANSPRDTPVPEALKKKSKSAMAANGHGHARKRFAIISKLVLMPANIFIGLLQQMQCHLQSHPLQYTTLLQTRRQMLVPPPHLRVTEDQRHPELDKTRHSLSLRVLGNAHLLQRPISRMVTMVHLQTWAAWLVLLAAPSPKSEAQ
jgi:hypothetical protein